jgi:Dyp-type peroxidase family
VIDLDEIQSIVIRPSSAATVDLAFVRLPDREAMRIFLRHAAEAVTTAAEVAARGPSPVDGGPASRSDAVCVGLTADGVRLAGVGGRALGALPATFLSGMRAAADRLGDVGPSAPGTWPAPFSGRAVVHAVVLRFGAGGLGRLAGWIPPDDATTWRGARLPGHREPFGFRDGISDPVIEGSGRKVHPGNGVWDAGRGRWRAVRTGEAVLGYTDESGEVAGHRDAAQLEVNGSYLVIRKLEQDVSGFHEECARWAEELGVTADDVAAQMVGRHRDGTVLGRRPPARGNDFLYTAEGGVGRDVPPSAHIRRANPRDDPIVGENLVRRHLMFRRGYPYDDGDSKGLLFLACCADLARQFEFVQARWLQDGASFDLGAERDPLIGARTADRRPEHMVSIGHRGARVRRALPSFVRTRGGEYVLLPSRAALTLLAAGD